MDNMEELNRDSENTQQGSSSQITEYEPPKPIKTRKKYKKTYISLVVLVILIMSALGTYTVLTSAVDSEENKIVVAFEVLNGDTMDSIITRLDEKNLIKNEAFAKLCAKVNGLHSFKVGNYKLNTAMNTKEILETLNNASKIEKNTVNVTIVEGSWAKDIAKKISKSTNLSEEDILNKWNDDQYIKELQKDFPMISDEVFDSRYRVKLEGYLFPNTYLIEKDTDVDTVTRMMLKETKKVYEKYKKQINNSKMSFHDIITFASVVQYESKSKDDMEMIAQVFVNRLNKNMRLQSSVTVCYAMYDFTSWEECESKANVIDSPYNTYLYAGLPIGPILNPGEDAIESVLNPKDNDYLYFVADVYGDGTVYYSKTFEEHDKKARELLDYYS